MAYLGFGNLVNPQAIALTRSNAYQAARIVMGIGAPITQAMSAAQAYTNFIIPKLNRAATVQQILGDLDFARFVSQAKDAADGSASDKVAKVEKEISGEFGLGDHLLGIPNYLLYGGLLVGGYFYYKKKKKSGGFNWFKKKALSAPASLVPSPVPTTTPVKA